MPLSPLPDSRTPPRVLIVDADRRVQQSLSDLLGITGEVDVVGRAGDVRAALEQVEMSHPDVVLMDPRLPDIEAGVALIGGMSRAWPGLRIVLTGWSDTEGHALTNVPTRYVSKDGTPEEFVRAVLRACA
ncbi:MAG TPA: response regulator transcription factor [Candidatus Limnocylindria bacterium]|nr:response regulator transcription factor [Candidatus Limnocylindria bacterium]